MATSLNSQNNQFVFSFPTDFVPKELQIKYKERLERMHSVFDDVIDYLNNSILSVTFPGLNFKTSEQIKRYGKTINYRSAQAPYDTYTNDVVIKLESVNNNANYFMLHDILMWHYVNTQNMFVNPFLIQILDQNRVINWQYEFREIIFTKISPITFSYAETDVKVNSFDLSFKFNYLDFIYIPEIKMPNLIKTKL